MIISLIDGDDVKAERIRAAMLRASMVRRDAEGRATVDNELSEHRPSRPPRKPRPTGGRP